MVRKPTFRRILPFIFLTLMSSIPVVSQGTREVLTNTKIIDLVKMGLSEALIVAKIKKSVCQCDTSTVAIGKLKLARVSDVIIMAMMDASEETNSGVERSSSNATASSPLPQQTQTKPENNKSDSLSDEQLKSANQPLVIKVAKSTRALIATSYLTMVQTKAKGDSLPTILADDTIRGIGSDAITTAASHAILAAPGIASIPIIGIAGTAILNMPGIRREPTYTFVYALPGRESKNPISELNPKFEIRYGDVVGANPDDFQPVLIKVSSTPNNWRLVGAQKSKSKWYQSQAKMSFNFIEEALPSTVTKLSRGQAVIEPQQPLSPGEYAVVLRPISNTYVISYKDIAYKSGEGSLVSAVWDFTIADPNPKADSNASISTQKPVSTITNPTSVPSRSDTGSNLGMTSPEMNGLPIYGNVLDIKKFRKVYVSVEDSQSRERIVNTLNKYSGFQLVSDPKEAEIFLEYKVLSRDSNMSGADKDVRTRSQLNAVYFQAGRRIIAWSEITEQARLTTAGIGFQTQRNEVKLTEKFIKAMAQ